MDERQMERLIDGIFSLKHFMFNRMTRYSELHLKNQEVSLAHLKILFALKRSELSTMSEIGRTLGVSKPNMTALVNKLVELELVKRVPKETDRRVIGIELTEKGQDYLKEYIEIMKNNFRNLLGCFDQDDLNLMETSVHNLKKMMDKLDLPE